MLLGCPALLVVLGGKCGVDVVGHNADLDRFAERLLDHPIPECAEIRDTGKEVGLLVGTATTATSVPGW